MRVVDKTFYGVSALLIGVLLLIVLAGVFGAAPLRVALAIVGLVLFFKALSLLLRARRVLGRNRWRSLRAHFGWGDGIDELARRLDLPPATLLAHTPSYRRVAIPKRDGAMRQLDIPDAATKQLQRRILRRLLARLKAHPAAHAYERGRSVATNAAPHVGRQVVIKLDVRDFFASTGAARVQRYFQAIGWNRQAAALLTALVTHEGRLPQGTPTSPRLANLINIGLDDSIARYVKHRRGTYTRYADDLTISFPEDWPRHIRSLVQQIRHVARACGYRLHGGRKLGIFRRHQRQQVCGVIVNDKPTLPRELRRRLRAARHALATQRPASWTAAQLGGWAAYERMIAAVPVPEAAPRARQKRWRRHLNEPRRKLG
jgi:hypothetical protein